MNYTTLHSGTTAPGNGVAIDILGAYQERLPPVLHVFITGTAAYVIEGSHNYSDWKTYLTSSEDEDRCLVVGVRWWRVRVTAVSGTVKAFVGAVPDTNGNNICPAPVTPGTTPVP